MEFSVKGDVAARERSLRKTVAATTACSGSHVSDCTLETVTILIGYARSPLNT
jgi:hypothetical protein